MYLSAHAKFLSKKARKIPGSKRMEFSFSDNTGVTGLSLSEIMSPPLFRQPSTDTTSADARRYSKVAAKKRAQQKQRWILFRFNTYTPHYGKAHHRGVLRNTQKMSPHYKSLISRAHLPQPNEMGKSPWDDKKTSVRGLFTNQYRVLVYG